MFQIGKKPVMVRALSYREPIENIQRSYREFNYGLLKVSLGLGLGLGILVLTVNLLFFPVKRRTR